MCCSLLALPARLAEVISLHHLSAYGCCQLRSLPPDLCRLPNLHRVCFDGCTQLGHEPHVGKELDELADFGCIVERPRPYAAAPPPPFSYRTVMVEALRELEMARVGAAPELVPEVADAALTQATPDSHRRPHRRTPWVLIEALADEKEAGAAESPQRRQQQQRAGHTSARRLCDASGADASGSEGGDGREGEGGDSRGDVRGESASHVPPFLCGHGSGRVELPDGAVYEGKWKDGRQEREGTYRFPPSDGRTYSGQWQAGRMHGRGTFTFGELNFYAGDFEDSVVEGCGFRAYPDGSRYTGGWRRGKKEGEGELTYANGDRFKGGWLADKRHGAGTYTYADGSSYPGQWLHDQHIRAPRNNGRATSPAPPEDPAETELRVASLANDELRTIIVDVRAGVPLQFRRPKGRMPAAFLRAENAELKAYLHSQDHVAMVGRVLVARQPTIRTLRTVKEVQRATTSPREAVEQRQRVSVAFHVPRHGSARAAGGHRK